MSYVGAGGLADIKARIYRERGMVALDASGDATITFTNPVSASEASHIQLTAWSGANENPVIVNPTGWIESGGERTGVTIKAARLRSLPSSILVLSALFSFKVWLHSDVDGTQVDWMLY